MEQNVYEGITIESIRITAQKHERFCQALYDVIYRDAVFTHPLEIKRSELQERCNVKKSVLSVLLAACIHAGWLRRGKRCVWTTQEGYDKFVKDKEDDYGKEKV